MSFQTFVTQTLAALTSRLNAIDFNAKKIDELPKQTPLVKSSKIHVSKDGVSKHIELNQIFDAFSSSKTKVIPITGNVTLSEGYNNNIAIQKTNSVITIPQGLGVDFNMTMHRYAGTTTSFVAGVGVTISSEGDGNSFTGKGFNTIINNDSNNFIIKNFQLSGNSVTLPIEISDVTNLRTTLDEKASLTGASFTGPVSGFPAQLDSEFATFQQLKNRTLKNTNTGNDTDQPIVVQDVEISGINGAVKIGKNILATEGNEILMGSNLISDGSYKAIVIGNDSQATNSSNAIVIGNDSQANTPNAIVIGREAIINTAFADPLGVPLIAIGSSGFPVGQIQSTTIIPNAYFVIQLDGQVIQIPCFR
jgi:hypothetical protein